MSCTTLSQSLKKKLKSPILSSGGPARPRRVKSEKARGERPPSAPDTISRSPSRHQRSIINQQSSPSPSSAATASATARPNNPNTGSGNDGGQPNETGRAEHTYTTRDQLVTIVTSRCRCVRADRLYRFFRVFKVCFVEMVYGRFFVYGCFP